MVTMNGISMLRMMYLRARRTWNPTQLVILQQTCFCLVLVLSTPLYMTNVNTDALLHMFETNGAIFSSVRLHDFQTVLTRLEERVHFADQSITFGSFTVVLAFAFAMSATVRTGKLATHGTNRSQNIIILSIISWIIVCFYVCLPLKFVLSSRLISIASFLQHPVWSLLSLMMFCVSIPFSLVAESPITFHGNETLVGLNEHLMPDTGGRVTIPSTVRLESLYTVSYNWRILIPLFAFVSACYMLVINVDCLQTERFSHDEEVIQSGSVRRISKTFETKNNAVSKPPTKLNLSKKNIVEEETIKPLTCSLVTHSKPRSPLTLAKVRPMKVTKLLQHNDLTSPSVADDNLKKVSRVETGIQWKPTMKTSSSQTDISTKDTKQHFKKPPPPPPAVQTKDTSVQLEYISTNHSSTQYDILVTKDTSIQCNVVFSMDTPTQCDVIVTKDTPMQCDTVVTKDTPMQCDTVVTKDTPTQCEILSQERYTKLQQNALALYKKTVDQQRNWYASLPKKIHVSSNTTKINKAVQVNIKHHYHHDTTSHEVLVDGHSATTNGHTKHGVDEQLVDNDTQTELYGYVLDKIIQERETSNVYSKSDLERTVHSVITLPEKIKQYTETIRFKAMKSQHGVWYVSLRGDVFLTVSQDILKNVKLNAERKIETEVSSDILRAMKTYVDNYNKLSDCFEDDEESDDESFINGFRL